MMILFIQSDDAVNPDRMYDLVAVVVHCGSGPNRGHYISIVKSAGFWLVFDDDLVDVSSIHNQFWHVEKLHRFRRRFDFPILIYYTFSEHIYYCRVIYKIPQNCDVLEISRNTEILEYFSLSFRLKAENLRNF